MVDQSDSRLNLDALELRSKPLLSTQVDNSKGVGPTQISAVISVDPLASSRGGGVAKSRCNI